MNIKNAVRSSSVDYDLNDGLKNSKPNSENASPVSSTNDF